MSAALIFEMHQHDCLRPEAIISQNMEHFREKKKSLILSSVARARQSGEEGLVHPQDSGPWMSFVGVGPTLPCTLGLHFSQCGSGLGQITVENKKAAGLA